MSSSNCCFLTCLQIYQEAGKVVWYSHLFKNFPQFVVILAIKGFGIVNKADAFLEFSCFFYDEADVCNLILGSPAFIDPVWTPGSSRFMYCWSLVWRSFSITLLTCEMSAIVQYFEHSLALPLCGIGMNTDLFQSFGHCWVFQAAGILSATL